MDTRFRSNDRERTTQTAIGDPNPEAAALLSQANALVAASAQVLDVIDDTLSLDSQEFLRHNQQHSGQ